MGESEDKYIKLKKPVVSQKVAEYIEATRGHSALELKIDVELTMSGENYHGVGTEVGEYIENCFDEFVLARTYGYRVI